MTSKIMLNQRKKTQVYTVFLIIKNEKINFTELNITLTK